jgi:DNA-directed RNA polymerase sigma subunit (sigma70/sigma32)
MFTPTRADSTACLKPNCQRKRNIENTARIKAGGDGARVRRAKQTQKGYDEILTSKYKIENFTYSKLLKQCIREVINNHNKDAATGPSKIVRAKAADLIQKKMKAMDPLDETTKLMYLERDYIIEFEKEKLRMNIKNTLNQDKIDGDYTLQEIGDVLGVTRERTRQLEADATKMMQRPGPARILRDYLDFQISTEHKM